MTKEITTRLTALTCSLAIGLSLSSCGSTNRKEEPSKVEPENVEKLQLIEKRPIDLNTLPDSMKAPANTIKVPDELRPPKP